ncbi:replication endonuclease, partial [Vibrio parahaemolyticus]|uniref:replication endonuclease n=1 Tax=Vibrio parahaemolyticus TaxID=670 RepID=UPI0011236FE7
ALRRLQSYSYCSRKLARLVLAEMLYTAQEKKQIGGKSGKAYATAMMKNYRKMQNDYNAEYLASKEIQLADKSVSLLSFANNAQKKVSELYAKVKGLENYANELGYGWAFLTMTAKAELHANPTKGKSSWNKSSAKAAQKELQANWEALGKELANLGYPMSEGRLFGMRVTEPHKDGTPHWHLICFYDLALDSDEKVRLMLE